MKFVNNNISVKVILFVSLLTGLMVSPSVSADSKLQNILSADHRTPAYKARDEYRHPIETLNFFGIKDNMTVVEIFPGGGWYTEILAPYLKDNGSYYAANTNPDSKSEFARKSAARFNAKMASNDVYSKVNITVLEPPANTEIAPPGSADAVLTFRNIHNWMKGGYADDVFIAMY
jgi:predicted methyltransferase